MQIAIHLDTSSKVTLQSQIIDQVAALIQGGKLKAGAALPSTRELSGQLGVSRNTVSEAYERLPPKDTSRRPRPEALSSARS